MPKYNSLTIIGHLGADAETRQIQSGDVVTSFSVGVSGFRKDDATQWFRCSWWGARGEKVSQYLTKGKPVLVRGSVGLRTFERKDGGSGASLEVRVDDVALLGGGDDSGPRTAPRQAETRKPARQEVSDTYPEDDGADCPF